MHLKCAAYFRTITQSLNLARAVPQSLVLFGGGFGDAIGAVSKEGRRRASAMVQIYRARFDLC